MHFHLQLAFLSIPPLQHHLVLYCHHPLLDTATENSAFAGIVLYLHPLRWYNRAPILSTLSGCTCLVSRMPFRRVRSSVLALNSARNNEGGYLSIVQPKIIHGIKNKDESIRALRLIVSNGCAGDGSIGVN
mmetsp:Transcript_21048/g.38053  ORF Transcript_21048/g.38053 Transcript_21048/m.38053 type:complete len:131 (+) Transcript_21048:120-512(+)